MTDEKQAELVITDDSSKQPDKETTALAPVGTQDMGHLMELALTQDKAEGLKTLMEINERLQDRAAAQEFASALSAFQEACPDITKAATANIPTKGGGSYSYKYAPLDHIIKTIRPVLVRYGLSFYWDSSIIERQMVCTCYLKHVNGHAESASFSCPTESSSAMSAQQKNASALTFAQRKSLEQVTGLTPTDADTDGAPMGVITAKQAADLECMITETGSNYGRFMKVYGITDISELPESCYKGAVSMLDAKRRKS